MNLWEISANLNPKTLKDDLYVDETDILNSNFRERCSNSIVKTLKKESKFIENIKNIVYYFPKSVPEVFGLFIEYVMDKGYKIKKCENCKQYFVLYGRSDAKYCSRYSPQDKNKTCGEYSKYQKQLKREKSNECTKAYKSLYNTLRNKMIHNEPVSDTFKLLHRPYPTATRRKSRL